MMTALRGLALTIAEARIEATATKVNVSAKTASQVLVATTKPVLTLVQITGNASRVNASAKLVSRVSIVPCRYALMNVQVRGFAQVLLITNALAMKDLQDWTVVIRSVLIIAQRKAFVILAQVSAGVKKVTWVRTALKKPATMTAMETASA